MNNVILFGQGDSAEIYYKTKFNTDSECLYIEHEGKQILYAPGFEYLRAQQEPLGVEVRKLTNIKEILQNLQGIYHTSWHLPFGITQHINAELVAEKQLWPQRLIKDKEEIAMIAHCQQQAAEATQIVIDILSKSNIVKGTAMYQGEVLTSEALKAAARNHLIHYGLDCPTIIISSGEQTQHPHDRGSGPIREGPVIIDVFPQSNTTRYHGDMTRTHILGESKEATKMLKAVREVHDLCVKKCMPGAIPSEIHEYCLNELEKRGYSSTPETGMIHALGHGVGLNIHEAPGMGPLNHEPLQKHMVVTIEPGLYQNGLGVRYENIVIVDSEPIILK